MSNINLLEASSIVLQCVRRAVEDDLSVTHSSGSVIPINLQSGQGAKILSVILCNTGGSAYTIDMGISYDNGSSFFYMYEAYSIAADTTWVAISPDTTGPVFMEENEEFRIHGSAGTETNVWMTVSYELIS